MLRFDKVPVMDKEYFDSCLVNATSFAVWVQVNPALQRLVFISKKQAKDIAYDGLQIMPIWGMMTEDGCLELSITSQWAAQLKIEDEEEEEEESQMKIYMPVRNHDEVVDGVFDFNNRIIYSNLKTAIDYSGKDDISIMEGELVDEKEIVECVCQSVIGNTYTRMKVKWTAVYTKKILA